MKLEWIAGPFLPRSFIFISHVRNNNVLFIYYAYESLYIIKILSINSPTS